MTMASGERWSEITPDNAGDRWRDLVAHAQRLDRRLDGSEVEDVLIEAYVIGRVHATANQRFIPDGKTTLGDVGRQAYEAFRGSPMIFLHEGLIDTSDVEWDDLPRGVQEAWIDVAHRVIKIVHQVPTRD